MVAGFTQMSRSRPGERAQAAKRWAEIYDSYARAAITANGGVLIFTGTEKTKLEAALLPAFLAPMGIGAAVAAAWGAGLAAYWGAPPIISTPAPIPVPPFVAPGLTLPPVGVPAVIAGLTTLYAVPSSSDSAFASAQASLLDACTRTVLVLFAPGGTFPLV